MSPRQRASDAFFRAGKIERSYHRQPQRFATKQAFYLGSIDVQLDTSSIRGNGPIVIKNITVEKPEVTYELLNSGSSNLQAIHDNARNYASAFQSGAAPAPSKTTQVGAQEGRKMVIKNFDIREGHVSISQELLKGKQLAPYPPFT